MIKKINQLLLVIIVGVLFLYFQFKLSVKNGRECDSGKY